MSSHLRWIRSLREQPVLKRLLAAARGQETFLTGGFLRDRILGGPSKAELDLTVADPGALLGRMRLAAGETVFVMDDERQTYRLVLPPSSPFVHIDVARLRDGTIEEDLRLRDFTVNALAVDLASPLPDPPLLDPTGGLADGRRRILRACSPRSFRDDPLRLLRGIRLSVGLGLSLERETRAMMKQMPNSLRRVSAERVRDELFQILQGPDPQRGMSQVIGLGLLDHLGPSFQPSSRRPILTQMGRTLTLIGECSPSGALREHLDLGVEYGVSRLGLLMLAAFLHDRDHRTGNDGLCRRLMLGKKASAIVARQRSTRLPRRWHRHPPGPTRRELLALYGSGDDCIEEIVLLHAARLSPAVIRRSAAMRFLARYRRSRLSPGPRLGELLTGAKEAQDLGLFRTAAGALRWARRTIREESSG
jgi:tRNA nucleotidyltransferase/poly(A) polymerase